MRIETQSKLEQWCALWSVTMQNELNESDMNCQI